MPADPHTPNDAADAPQHPSLIDEETEALRSALARMKLVDDDEAARFAPLTGGVSSLIVVAHTARGPLCVKRALERLKVAADWRAPVERNQAEVAWIRTVATIAPDSVPRVLGHDAEGDAFAMEYLPPEQFQSWKALLLAGSVDPATAARVAHVLAAIHAATARTPGLQADFDNADNFFALRLDPYFGEAARRHPDLAPVLQRLIDDVHRRRTALVHGDVSPKNLMIGPRGPIFLDAECATYGDPAFDLSFCLNHLLLKQVCRPALRAPLAACFDAMAGTYLPRVDWEPPDEFERRAAALLPALLLARVDGKSPVEYLDEAQRTFVRRFAVERLHTPPATLSTLALAWKDSLSS
ncbi:MAG: phosphotransferase [Burkholderiaceae bacterium]|nr:phosphotransferase [Burkholderiaceae bacterium]